MESFIGNFIVPGDKSISHRALILASQIIGKVTIENVCDGNDISCTVDSLVKLGVPVYSCGGSKYEVSGRGVGGLTEPDTALDMKNSGTAVRLMMGLISTYPFKTFFFGDKNLSSRPMKRVMEPLSQMGVNFLSDSLPLVVIGQPHTVPINYTMKVPSAQVKTAILLAALNTQGITTIIEPYPLSRDHSEVMLKFLGACIEIEFTDEVKIIKVTGQKQLEKHNMCIPGDPSAAAFLVALALITPNSDMTIPNVCINETRFGFYEILKIMNANINIYNERFVMGEKVADIRVKSSVLNGVEVDVSFAPSTIDEYPILSILAAYAHGVTRMKGVKELRIKESDRIKSMIIGLQQCGVEAYDCEEEIKIIGTGKVEGGALVSSFDDHRVAISFLICGTQSHERIKIDDITAIDKSFPAIKQILCNAVEQKCN